MSGNIQYLKGRLNIPLPPIAYVDQSLFALEKELFFDNSIGYVGHELMVPNVGDYYVLDNDEAFMLVRNEQGIQLLSNVCRHRDAIMLHGHGNVRNIVCPAHRWTYDTQGRILGSPGFSEKQCLNLDSISLKSWRGLLFDRKRDIVKELAGAENLPELDFTGYVLHNVERQECNFNWKTFLDFFLDSYHIASFHPGFNGFVDCDHPHYQFAERWSLHALGVQTQLKQAGSPVFQKWQDEILKYSGGKVPEQVSFFTYYPNLMIECYPHMKVVSYLIPRDVNHTTNIMEFYFPQEVALFEPELSDAGFAAYMETSREDDELALRMNNGRAALARKDLARALGPYQSPLEDAVQHFHGFLRSKIRYEKIPPQKIRTA